MADQTAPDTVVVNQNVDTNDTEAALRAIPAIVSETKAGYRTTEFWLAVVTSLLVVLNGIPLPDKYEGIVVAGLAAVYTLSRGIAKQGIPVVEESPVAVAPTTGD